MVEAVVTKLTFKEYLLESIPLSNLINDEVEKEEKAGKKKKAKKAIDPVKWLKYMHDISVSEKE